MYLLDCWCPKDTSLAGSGVPGGQAFLVLLSFFTESCEKHGVKGGKCVCVCIKRVCGGPESVHNCLFVRMSCLSVWWSDHVCVYNMSESMYACVCVIQVCVTALTGMCACVRQAEHAPAVQWSGGAWWGALAPGWNSGSVLDPGILLYLERSGVDREG